MASLCSLLPPSLRIPTWCPASSVHACTNSPTILHVTVKKVCSVDLVVIHQTSWLEEQQMVMCIKAKLIELIEKEADVPLLAVSCNDLACC